MTTRVQPDPLVVQRQNDLFDLWHRFADQHVDDPEYDPDDDPEFHAEARRIMGMGDPTALPAPAGTPAEKALSAVIGVMNLHRNELPTTLQHLLSDIEQNHAR